MDPNTGSHADETTGQADDAAAHENSQPTGVLARTARWATQHRRTVVLGWIAVLVISFGEVNRMAGVEVDRREDLLLDLDLDRDLDLAQAADALERELRREIGRHDQTAVRP